MSKTATDLTTATTDDEKYAAFLAFVHENVDALALAAVRIEAASSAAWDAADEARLAVAYGRVSEADRETAVARAEDLAIGVRTAGHVLALTGAVVDAMGNA
jgi:predicted metalloprotease with PDZ domain